MRDRFDVFLEALSKNINIHTNPYRALTIAIQAVAKADEENDKLNAQVEEDIHYQDRYGKGE